MIDSVAIIVWAISALCSVAFSFSYRHAVIRDCQNKAEFLTINISRQRAILMGWGRLLLLLFVAWPLQASFFLYSLFLHPTPWLTVSSFAAITVSLVFFVTAIRYDLRQKNQNLGYSVAWHVTLHQKDTRLNQPEERALFVEHVRKRLGLALNWPVGRTLLEVAEHLFDLAKSAQISGAAGVPQAMTCRFAVEVLQISDALGCRVDRLAAVAAHNFQSESLSSELERVHERMRQLLETVKKAQEGLAVLTAGGESTTDLQRSESALLSLAEAARLMIEEDIDEVNLAANNVAGETGGS